MNAEKLMTLVFERRKDLKTSWLDSFEQLGIDDDVAFIYDQGWSVEFANRVFAFIILSYHPKSGWIELHKNRIDDKRKIMKRLGGDLSDRDTAHIIEGGSIPAARLRAWLMDYLRDWRWDSVMACFDYHAEMMRFGSFRTVAEMEEMKYRQDGDDIIEEKEIRSVPIDKLAKGNADKGSSISLGIAKRKEGEALLEEIRKEFAVLDEVLVKEGFKKISSQTDIPSWEEFIASVRNVVAI